MSDVKDPYQTKYDKGPNLGLVSFEDKRPLTSRPVLIGKSVQLGGIFEDIGGWFEQAAEDVGGFIEGFISDPIGAFEDAFNWVVDAFEWLADGPILHVAAGLCALIPGVGVGAAAAIEGAYAIIQSTREVLSEVEGLTTKALDEAEKATMGMASRMGANVPKLQPSEARAKIDGAIIASASGDLNAIALVTGSQLMGETLAVSAKYPDILNVKGAANLASDKRLPEKARVLAAAALAIEVVKAMPNTVYRKEYLATLSGYLRGKDYLIAPMPPVSPQEMAKPGNVVRLQLGIIFAGHGLPMKLTIQPHTSPIKPLPPKPVPVVRTFEEEQEVRLVELLGKLTVSGKIPWDATWTGMFGTPTPKDRTGKTQYVGAAYDITKWNGLRKWLLETTADKLVYLRRWMAAETNREKAAGRTEAQARANVAMSLMTYEPYRPSVVLLTMSGNANQTLPDMYGLKGEDISDWFFTPQSATAFGKLVRAQFLQLPYLEQVGLATRLANNAYTKDLLYKFLEGIFGQAGQVKFPAWWAVPYVDPKSNFQTRNSELLRSMNEAAKNWIANEESIREGSVIAVQSTVGAALALIPTPKKREGVRVRPGVIGYLSGVFVLDDPNGPDVVVSIDGTAELGTWRTV